MKKLTTLIAGLLCIWAAESQQVAPGGQSNGGKKPGVLVGDRMNTQGIKKDGDMPTGTKKDGVLVGDRNAGTKDTQKDDDGEMGNGSKGGETNHGNRDGETGTSNRDGVLVGDRKGGTKNSQKDDSDTEHGNKDGETNSGNRDGVLVGDRKGSTKKDGVLISDKAKDGVLVGDRKAGTRDTWKDDGDMGNGGETTQGNRDDDNPGGKGSDVEHGNRTGVPVGDKIAEINTAAVIRVYPNPATDQVTATAPEGKNIALVQFFNIEGRQVMALPGNRSNNMKINLGALNPGTWIFRITFSDGSVKATTLTRK